MARLSAVGAPATPDQTEDSEERSLTGAGAMATSNASINALQRDNTSTSPGIKDMFRNTTNAGAMGQTESRETVRKRNNALHRAPGQAVVPKAGRLPRRSGGLSHVVSGQRRLGRSVLADASTYDVPSDGERAPRRRQAATTTQFSPLKRQLLQQSREEKRRQEERERQAALDRQLDLVWERESEKVVEDIKSRRGGSRAGLSGEETAVHEVPESDAEEPEVLINALDEPLPEPPQQAAAQKKRGRPRKSRPGDEEPEQASALPRRKRGRPSYAEKEAEARRLAAQDEEVEESVILVAPFGMTDELGHTSPPQVTRIATTQNQRFQRSIRSTAAGLNTVLQASSSRPRRTSADHVVPQSGSNSRHQITVDEEDEPLFVENDDTEQPDIVRPEELDGLNDEEYDFQTYAADVQPASEEDLDGEGSTDYDGSEGDDDDEHVDETEIQLEPAANDRHRLYGHWHKMREVMREVAKHRGSTVRIKDDEFKEVLQDCEDATTTVLTLSAGVSPGVLNQTVVQCRDAIARAGSICCTGEALTNSREARKRSFHIFKHLLPALAKLLRASVKAFERVDGVGNDTQIPLDHLSKILELLSAVVECGESANRSYPAPSRPIKQNVHKGITMSLCELLSSLNDDYTAEIRRQEAQQRNEEIARMFAAQEESRERRDQRRRLERHNQEKWKRMNSARFNASFNTLKREKLAHLRSCGMQLVQTDADGQPYLPTNLRDMRGEWSMLEIEALEASLRRHVDTPAPTRSMVFEKLFAEQCQFRKPLADKNVLEIVIKSNELKNFYIQRSRERGTAVEEWVSKIPRWMDPPVSEDDGISLVEEDAIEIG
ncbi:hypothetical protein Q7P35_004686 [Cladosporium inversicolor]